MEQYKWLLMDADNTLFDFNAAEEYALTRTLIRHQVSPTAETKALYRSINSQLWGAYDKGEISQEEVVSQRFALLMKALGLQGDSEAWNSFYLAALADCPVLLPGAEKLCYRLSDWYVLALTTNGVSQVQRSRLKKSPLAPYFKDRVFISGEMGCRKPEKAYYDKVLGALGARNQRGKVLVVGDSLSSDIQGAFNARLDSVWLRRPGQSAGAPKPTYEVESLAQLGQLLGVERYVPFQL